MVDKELRSLGIGNNGYGMVFCVTHYILSLSGKKIKKMKRFLKIYKKTANFLGRINTKIILSIFYFTVIPVFKVIFLFVKPKSDLNSNWKIKEKSNPDEHKHLF